MMGVAVVVFACLLRFHSSFNEYAENLMTGNVTSPDIDLEKDVYLFMYLVVGLGVMCAITGLVGMFGAICENWITLVVYLCLIVSLILGAGMNVADENIKDAARVYNSESVQHPPPQRLYYLDKLQEEFKCCGCDNAKNEYSKDESGTVLWGKGCEPKPETKPGCCGEVDKAMLRKLWIGVAVISALLFLEFMRMIFCGILIRFVGATVVTKRGGVTFVLDKSQHRKVLKGSVSETSTKGSSGDGSIRNKSGTTPPKQDKAGPGGRSPGGRSLYRSKGSVVTSRKKPSSPRGHKPPSKQSPKPRNAHAHSPKGKSKAGRN